MTNFAKVAEVKAGDWLKADGGFTCIIESTKMQVKEGDAGSLWVPCAKGRHYLAGQVDDDSQQYTGLTKVEEPGSGK